MHDKFDSSSRFDCQPKYSFGLCGYAGVMQNSMTGYRSCHRWIIIIHWIQSLCYQFQLHSSFRGFLNHKHDYFPLFPWGWLTIQQELSEFQQIMHMQMQLKDSQLCRLIFYLFLFALKLNTLWIFWLSLIISFRFYWKRWSFLGLCATDRTGRWSHNSLVAARSEWIIRRYVHSKNQLLNLFKLVKRRTKRQKCREVFESVHEHQHPIFPVVVKQTWKIAYPYGEWEEKRKKQNGV